MFIIARSKMVVRQGGMAGIDTHVWHRIHKTPHRLDTPRCIARRRRGQEYRAAGLVSCKVDVGGRVGCVREGEGEFFDFCCHLSFFFQPPFFIDFLDEMVLLCGVCCVAYFVCL